MIRIEMENGGIIDLELDHSAAPKTAANFEKLAKEGFYNGKVHSRALCRNGSALHVQLDAGSSRIDYSSQPPLQQGMVA